MKALPYKIKGSVSSFKKVGSKITQLTNINLLKYKIHVQTNKKSASAQIQSIFLYNA